MHNANPVEAFTEYKGWCSSVVFAYFFSSPGGAG
jgi:hypothetical protein